MRHTVELKSRGFDAVDTTAASRAALVQAGRLDCKLPSRSFIDRVYLLYAKANA
jgi:hypothetical protein